MFSTTPITRIETSINRKPKLAYQQPEKLLHADIERSVSDDKYLDKQVLLSLSNKICSKYAAK